MELRQLGYFVAVAEELHFGRAARRLHVVQPAVSQQIRKLETELGVRLLDRDNRTVRLTEAGALLLPEARAVLAAAERVTTLAGELASTDSLRVGTPEGLGPRLEVILARMYERHPHIQVTLESLSPSARIERVRDGRLDAAILRSHRATSGLVDIPLWTDQLVAALPAEHVLAGEAVLPFRRLESLPLRLAARADSPTFVDMIMSACRTAGFTPVLGGAFTTLQNTLAQLGSGPPSWTVLYEETALAVPTRRIAFRRLTDPTLVVKTSMVIREPTPSLKSLIDVCVTSQPGGA